MVSPSEIEWSSVLHEVQKSYGTYRPVDEYKQLNSITKTANSIPNINSLTHLLGKKIFSRINLSLEYHQIQVHPDDVYKITIFTEQWLFNNHYMHSGLRNAASTSQRMLHDIFRDSGYTFVYIDDILIYLDDEHSHLKNLDEVFQKLSEYNNFHFKVCVRCCRTWFLEFPYSQDGIKSSSNKLLNLKNFPKPEKFSSWKIFLNLKNFPIFENIAMIYWNRQFLLKISSEIQLYTECIRLNPNAKRLTLTTEELFPFQAVKDSLSNLKIIRLPKFECSSYHSVTDISNYAMDAALR